MVPCESGLLIYLISFAVVVVAKNKIDDSAFASFVDLLDKIPDPKDIRHYWAGPATISVSVPNFITLLEKVV